MPKAAHRFVNVDGIRTHYVAVGTGPPVLLLHGLGASMVAWTANIGPLSRRHKVYAIDLPGHGDSDKPGPDSPVLGGVGYTQALMEALRIRKASLIGNSTGGLMALATALASPDMVEKLVLVDAAGLGRDLAWSLRLVSLPVLGEILETPSRLGTRTVLRGIFHDRGLAKAELLTELHRTRRMRGAKETLLRSIRNAVSFKGLRSEWMLADRLRELAMPTLILWGAQNRILPARHAREAATLAPAVRLQVFDRCGHWPQMEKSEEFNQAVLDFLNET